MKQKIKKFWSEKKGEVVTYGLCAIGCATLTVLASAVGYRAGAEVMRQTMNNELKSLIIVKPELGGLLQEAAHEVNSIVKMNKKG